MRKNVKSVPWFGEIDFAGCIIVLHSSSFTNLVHTVDVIILDLSALENQMWPPPSIFVQFASFNYISSNRVITCTRHVKMDSASRVSLEAKLGRNASRGASCVEHLACHSIINRVSSIPMPLEPSSVNRAQNVSQISRGRLVDREMSVPRFSRDSREGLACFVQFLVSSTVFTHIFGNSFMCLSRGFLSSSIVILATLILQLIDFDIQSFISLFFNFTYINFFHVFYLFWYNYHRLCISNHGNSMLFNRLTFLPFSSSWTVLPLLYSTH